MNEGVADRCWNDGIDRDENDGAEDRDEKEGVEDRGGLKLGVLDRLDRDGKLNDRLELDGALNDRLDRDGALNDGLEREPKEREPNEGDDRELNDGDREPPKDREPPNDRPGEERAEAPPDERDTDALRAQVEVGITRANTAVASPRVRTTKWCDNIIDLAVVSKAAVEATRQILSDS